MNNDVWPFYVQEVKDGARETWECYRLKCLIDREKGKAEFDWGPFLVPELDLSNFTDFSPCTPTSLSYEQIKELLEVLHTVCEQLLECNSPNDDLFALHRLFHTVQTNLDQANVFSATRSSQGSKNKGREGIIKIVLHRLFVHLIKTTTSPIDFAKVWKALLDWENNPAVDTAFGQDVTITEVLGLKILYRTAQGKDRTISRSRVQNLYSDWKKSFPPPT